MITDEPAQIRTLSSMRSSRKKKRDLKSANSNTANTANSTDVNIQNILQQKLQDTWEALQATTFSKLSFMRKYSSSVYAGDFVKAVDRWSHAAALVFCKYQIIKLSEKLQKNLCLMPIRSNTLIKLLKEPHLPSSFVSDDPALIPSSQTSVPSSLDAIREIYEAVDQEFSVQGDEIYSVNDAIAVLNRINVALDTRLTASLKTTIEELDDIVPYGSLSLKEWLSKVKKKETEDVVTAPLTPLTVSSALSSASVS